MDSRNPETAISSNETTTMKEKILEAALQHFSEVGYHGVSVPQIARSAGVAVGSLYNHFKNKDDLVNALFYTWKLKLKEYYLDGFPMTASPHEQFQFIWARLHAFANDYPKAFQFIEYHMHGSYLRSECLALEEEIFEIGRSFIRASQDRGVIRPGNPQVLVGYFFGAFVQYFKDCLAGREIWSNDASSLIRDMCWAGLSSTRI